MKKVLLAAGIVLTGLTVSAQIGPEISCWILNTTGATGYNSIPSNVQQVQYSTGNVYVSCTCIPGYDIGPWIGNPNTPVNQNFVYKITRTPVQNTGTPVATGLGHIGVWTNGVSIFNAKDAMSYNNAGVWNQNAIVVEGAGFDTCLGHPAPNGEYHHHLNPRCLYDDHDSSAHSPIIGYAFDGFPIYGAYGYANPNGTGGITRMKSSYREQTYTTRTNGPAVNATYPIGYYVEDFYYSAGWGDLDEHNGRFCVTPEYPGGIYAYFVTLDANLDAQYPYTLGPTYYGTVPTGNTGPNGGHNTVTESVTTYNPTGFLEIVSDLAVSIFPSPASVDGTISVFIKPADVNDITMVIFDLNGKEVRRIEYMQPAITYYIDLTGMSAGMYTMRFEYGGRTRIERFVVAGQ
jgi:hypothetical protein